MLKNIDVVSQHIFAKSLSVSSVLGIKEDAVGATTYRLPQHVKDAVHAAKEAVLDGSVTVPDYTDVSAGYAKCLSYGIDDKDTYRVSLKIL